MGVSVDRKIPFGYYVLRKQNAYSVTTNIVACYFSIKKQTQSG